jgi:hypothetical protein
MFPQSLKRLSHGKQKARFALQHCLSWFMLCFGLQTHGKIDLKAPFDKNTQNLTWRSAKYDASRTNVTSAWSNLLFGRSSCASYLFQVFDECQLLICQIWSCDPTVDLLGCHFCVDLTFWVQLVTWHDLIGESTIASKQISNTLDVKSMLQKQFWNSLCFCFCSGHTRNMQKHSKKHDLLWSIVDRVTPALLIWPTKTH